VQLVDTELTAHLLGEHKHTSTLQAQLKFVRLPLEAVSAESERIVAAEEPELSHEEATQHNQSSAPAL